MAHSSSSFTSFSKVSDLKLVYLVRVIYFFNSLAFIAVYFLFLSFLCFTFAISHCIHLLNTISYTADLGMLACLLLLLQYKPNNAIYRDKYFSTFTTNTSVCTHTFEHIKHRNHNRCITIHMRRMAKFTCRCC